MNNLLKTSIYAVAGLFFNSTSHAIPVNYIDLSAFTSAGDLSIIQFNELTEGATVGNQYANLGVLFNDLNDTTLADAAFLSDGVGLNGHGAITLQFSSPITMLGALFPGALTIQLFSNGSAIGSSAAFGGSGEGYFGGIISATPFNVAVLSDWSDGHAFVDNLYFGSATGSTVPDAPNTAALLLTGVTIAALCTRCLRPGLGRRMRRN